MDIHKYIRQASQMLAATALALVLCPPMRATVPNADSPSAPLQKESIRGTVKDAKTGDPLIGVSVIVKGSSIGTVTDMNGNFTLNVEKGTTLSVSYVGYRTREVTANSQMTIMLSENAEQLDEVVVVGYGTQKKVNLSGSVASVNVGKIVESRPITNLSQALAGAAAGIQVTSSANRPGSDEATILVRGQGTLNSSSPLIIVDGVESSINAVNPQDIASVSVLKDAASSAIYGSRAANGVILITTKKGESGSFKIDYNGYVSFESVRIPDSMRPVSNTADYMELINEGLENSGQAILYQPDKIESWRNDAGKNPLLYPNTDWIDEVFRSTAAQNHILSASGGTEKIRFYTSMGYMKNPGVMENTGTEKFNGRFNVEANLKPWLTLGMQLSGFVSNSDLGDIESVFNYGKDTTPAICFRAPDGRYGFTSNPEEPSVNNLLRYLNNIDGKNRKENIRARFMATVKPIKDLSISASYSYESNHESEDSKPVFIDLWDFRANSIAESGVKKSYVTNKYARIERNFWDITIDYTHRWLNDRLGLKAMAGASAEQYFAKNLDVTKDDMIDIGLGTVFDAAIGASTASGTSNSWAMNSGFGRINLDWENKYLLELNLRADGSSRFADGNRWGYFPSFSAAWRMDQEPFMKKLADAGLTNLKIRGSYGSLGNNSVGNYESIPVYAESNYVLNNAVAPGLAITALANQALTWESTYVTNIGVDFGLARGRLNGTIEYFHKKTKDILIALPAPDVHGTATLPTQNSAQVSNKGVEFSIGWNDNIGDFFYSANANMTYVKNNVDKYKGKGIDGREINETTLLWEGHPINCHYLLEIDRIVQTDEDVALVQSMIDNAPTDEKTGQKKDPFASYGTPEKGDILYKDTNGDGLINDEDRTIASDGNTPNFYWGINLNLSWKGIDFSALIQGVEGCKTFWRYSGYNTPTVTAGDAINKELAEGRWYEGRTDAVYPRLLASSDSRNNQNSTLFLYDNSYVKIRNIQIGYSLPKRIIAPLRLERLRIYGSLENFFTFTKYKGLDPEVSGLNYPTMKQAVIGINLTF